MSKIRSIAFTVALQIRSIAFTVALICGGALTVIVPIILAVNLTGIPASKLVDDPTYIMKAPFFVGFLSNMGVLLWAATTAILLFSAFLSIRTVHRSESSGFLLCSGLLTGLLTLDDLFLLHEEVFPVYVGIDENVVHAAYLVCISMYLLYFRTMILRTDYLLLGMALGLFAVSMIVDFRLFYLRYRILLEDAAKFIGIAFWLGYFVRVSASVLLSTRKFGGQEQPKTPGHGVQ